MDDMEMRFLIANLEAPKNLISRNSRSSFLGPIGVLSLVDDMTTRSVAAASVSFGRGISNIGAKLMS